MAKGKEKIKCTFWNNNFLHGVEWKCLVYIQHAITLGIKWGVLCCRWFNLRTLQKFSYTK